MPSASTRRPTARLRHVAHIGVRARPFSYAINGLTMPDGRRARARSPRPMATQWEWGESDTDRVTGPALDFCLVVTQRRHVADTALEIVGDAAAEWIGDRPGVRRSAPGAGRQRRVSSITDR